MMTFLSNLTNDVILTSLHLVLFFVSLSVPDTEIPSLNTAEILLPMLFDNRQNCSIFSLVRYIYLTVFYVRLYVALSRI